MCYRCGRTVFKTSGQLLDHFRDPIGLWSDLRQNTSCAEAIELA
jgi:hypothetical protein